MSVPKKKLSRTRVRSRRSHDAISTPAASTCANCGKTVRPHYACSNCGMYRGKKVV